ncbi:MAG: type II 3-dehydroquinate dehydratase [Rubricella sp.]
MRKIHILNGPNLNLLGQREPDIYGHDTLDDIAERCADHAEGRAEITFRQTNSEGTLVDHIHEARAAGADVIINAAAYTHTSIAVLDALKTVEARVIELHLSNPHRREAFRHVSYVALAADGVIAGFGARGYLMAIDALLEE